MVPSVEGSSPFAHPRMTAGPEPYGSGPPLLHRGVAKRLRHGTLTPASLVRVQPSQPYDPVAQLVEHLPFKPVVRGSSPRRVTTSEQASYRLLRLFSKVRARSFCCSSFPHENTSCFRGGPVLSNVRAASILSGCYTKRSSKAYALELLFWQRVKDSSGAARRPPLASQAGTD